MSKSDFSKIIITKQTLLLGEYFRESNKKDNIRRMSLDCLSAHQSCRTFAPPADL
jgi:hypothetical protein